MLTNDSDVEGPLSISSVTQPANGAVVVNGNAVIYTPHSSFAGNDSFTYTVKDSDDAAASANVSVVVDTTVPNVVGSMRSAAEATLTADVLTVGTVTEVWSASVPVGQVMSQSVAEGTVVTAGTAVDLTVSKGPEKVAVPDVEGQTLADAETALTNAKLVSGTISEVFSDSVADGKVISQSVAAGTSVVIQSAVDLLVSKGPYLGSGSGMKVTATSTEKVIADLSTVKSASGVTVEGWMKLPTSATYGSWQRGPSVLTADGTVIGFSMANEGAADTVYFHLGGTGVGNLFIVRGIRDDKWHHYAVTIDQSASGAPLPAGSNEVGRRAARIYLDGLNIFSQEAELEARLGKGIKASVHKGNAAYNPTVDLTRLITGGWPTADAAFCVDELRIWSEARTQAQVRENMNRYLPAPEAETELVAYYSCNGTTDDLVDETGQFSSVDLFADANYTSCLSGAGVVNASGLSGWNLPSSVGQGIVKSLKDSALSVDNVTAGPVDYTVISAVNMETGNSSAGDRLKREWYMYTEGAVSGDVTVDLSIAGTVPTVDKIKLLYREKDSEAFIELDEAAVMSSSSTVQFSGLNLESGFYTIGFAE